MSPHRQLSQSSNRHPTQDQDIFLGFASSLSPPDKEHPDAPRKLDYSFVLHDGSGVVESEDYTFELTVPDDEEEAGKEVSCDPRVLLTDSGQAIRVGGLGIDAKDPNE